MSITKIDAHHIAKAGDRYLDFNQVNQAPLEKRKAAMARIDAGEDPMQVFTELSENGSALAALTVLKAGLGLTHEAQEMFWEILPELLTGLELIEGPAACEVAAQLGMILGLTAQQLAAEDAAKGLTLR